MKRGLALAGSAVAMFAWANQAGASGDYSCEPEWRMPGRSGCGETAMLSPANDTRVNLLFLLRDKQGLGRVGLPPAKLAIDDYSYGRTFFSWHLMRRAFFADTADEGEPDGAGSRCQTASASAPLFGAALAQNRGVPPPERSLLEAARGQIGCKSEAIVWPASLRSAAGQEFLGYLQGADAFYAGRWDEARTAISARQAARDPWVAETARYMLGRSELNAAQAPSFNEYGDFDGPEKIDKAALQRARAAFEAYLRHYPRGRYAGSAQGLVRRGLWLAGDVAGLSREYERLLAAVPGSDIASARLVQEIDNKLLMRESAGAAVDGPLLLATIDLMRMRPEDEQGKASLSLSELEAQQPRFAGRPDLYSYLLASHVFHVGKDARRVLELIPDEARAAGYGSLAFSRQVLRGMALASLGDRNEARFWRDLLGGADPIFQRPVVELALALNLEKNGRLAEVFAPSSPIQDSAIREILLVNSAGPALLRAQAQDGTRPRHERDVALLALLYKGLAHGLYADFLRDRTLIPAEANTNAGFWSFPLQQENPVGLFAQGSWSGGDYTCPTLAVTTTSLARNSRDAKALLCLGEFYRLNGFDDLVRSQRERKPGELGRVPDGFPGRLATRDVLYAQVIADPAAPATEKAYALYRAARCYAPIGNSSCGPAQVDVSVRRGWFQRLKRDYPKSQWAKELTVYW